MRNLFTATAIGILLTGTLAASASAGDAASKNESGEPQVLEMLVVRENAPGSAEAVREELKRVPGGVNFINTEALKDKSAATLGSALAYQPGVVLQEFFGGMDQPRLNIRGSGIQSNPLSRGIELLENGLSINQADGSFIIGQLEPRMASYISVYRGANALRHGGASLGGAVNFQQYTGYDAEGVSGRAEAGSYGYLGGQAAIGGVRGDVDAYASYTRNSASGFQGNSDSDRQEFLLNAGYRPNQETTLRLTYTYTDLRFGIPVAISKDQLKADPRQNFEGFPFFVSRTTPERNALINRLAGSGETAIGEGRLGYGVFLQDVDDTFKTYVRYRFTDGTTYGGRLGYETPGVLFGLRNNLVFGVRGSWGDMTQTYNLNNRWPGFGPIPPFTLPGYGDVGLAYGSAELSAWNVALYAEDTLSVTDRLDVVLGGQYMAAARDAEHKTAALVLDQDYDAFVPRFGLLYAATPGMDVFFNLSRSFEAPTFDEIVIDQPMPAGRGISFARLDAQTATTAEIGARGEWRRVRWEAAFYQSWVRDELLQTTDGLGNSTTRNYGKTDHRGIELGAEAGLWRAKSGSEISLRGMYTLSDFSFANGLYDGRQIAGVPRHVVQAEIRYEDAGGFYVAPNVYWAPEKTPTDHMNTLYQDAYALAGLSAGYRSGKGWTLFVEGKNIFDKKYASSYLITDTPAFPYPANGKPVFVSGAGASLNAGITFSW